jgi:hypothetical protein
MLTIIIIFIFGSIDFLLFLYDWNSAIKAVQVGARIASVSDPVAKGLEFLSASSISRTSPPGAPMPTFSVVCDGAGEKCSCTGSCPEGPIGFDRTAIRTIVYGRGSAECGDATSSYSVGMCDIFSRITPANVKIEYRQPPSPAGLGYVGRPGGPVPTIKLSLVNIQPQLFFLDFLLHDLRFPEISTTVTAEDLSSCAPQATVCTPGR